MANDQNNGKPLKVVGKPFRKVDARAKCTGQDEVADDIVLPSHALLQDSPYSSSARVNQEYHVSKAVATQGVFAVITGRICRFLRNSYRQSG